MFKAKIAKLKTYIECYVQEEAATAWALVRNRNRVDRRSGVLVVLEMPSPIYPLDGVDRAACSMTTADSGLRVLTTSTFLAASRSYSPNTK